MDAGRPAVRGLPLRSLRRSARARGSPRRAAPRLLTALAAAVGLASMPGCGPVSAVALVAVAAGSGGGGGGSGGAESPALAAATIGPSGGQVSGGGVTIVVPPGALTTPVTITIRDSPGVDLARVAIAGRVVGAGFALGPSGQAFLAPVQVTVPVSSLPSSAPASAVTLLHETPSRVDFARPVLVGSGAVTFELASFSTVQPFLAEPPLLTDVTPPSGPVSEESPIEIRGEGFAALAGTVEVLVGGRLARSVVVRDATRITALAPTGLGAGAVPVLVTNGDGQLATTSLGFTYLAVPGSARDLRTVFVDAARVDLAWTDGSDDEDGFRIERSFDANGGFVAVATVAADEEAGSDPTVDPATSYFYRVVAFNDLGDGLPTNVLAVATLPRPPAAPSELTADAAAPTRVELAWTDRADDETGFRVERALADTGSFAAVGEAVADAEAFADPTAAAATSYDYRVLALNAGGDSAPSNVARVTTPLPSPPLAPTALVATALAFDRVGLVWTAGSNDASGFQIERADGGTASFAVLASVGAAARAFEDATVEASSTYDYRVIAFHQGGTSPPSPLASATTPDGPPRLETPQDLVAMGRAHRVLLSWEDASATETGFRVERRVQGTAIFDVVAALAPNATEHRDLGVVDGTTYEYRVIAVGAAPDSLPSATALASAPALPPLAFAVLARGERKLYEVRTDALGAPATLGTVSAATTPTSLAAASAERLLLADLAAGHVVAFSLTTGTTIGTPLAVDVGLDAQVRGLATHPKGWLATVRGGRELRFIHPTSGVTFHHATLGGAARIEAIAFDPWGRMYAAGSATADAAAERLYSYRLDDLGDALVDVGPFGVPDIDGLTFASDGFLYGVATGVGVASRLYRIDPATGKAQDLGSTGVFEASGIEEIPVFAAGAGDAAPHVRRAVPPTLVSGTTTQVILEGERLAGGAVLDAVSAGVAIVSQRSATGTSGDLLVAEVRTDAGPIANPIELEVHTAAGAFRVYLEGLDGEKALRVIGSETVRLAGANRLRSLRVHPQGALLGVGLVPLMVSCDESAAIDGRLDVSGEHGFRPIRWSPAALCGRGGDGGPGGGGGGGGGASHPVVGTDDTHGAEGGWGLTGGGGGGGTHHPAGAGGLSAADFGAPGQFDPAGYAPGGDGGVAPLELGGAAGGFAGTSGGGGGTGDGLGIGGRAGDGIAPGPGPAVGQGGGGGAHHRANGGGSGGGGGFGTAGQAGTGAGGAGGAAHGDARVDRLPGGSGGGGGSGRGGFEGLAAGGGGGGGALLLAARQRVDIGPGGVVRSNGGRGGKHPNSEGEGGGGSGGTILLEADTVAIAGAAAVEALGDETLGAGDGGEGRIRVDAARYEVDGATVGSLAFQARTAPAVGFFGGSTPAIALGAIAATGSNVSIPFTVFDADHARVSVDIEYAVGGGPFVAATAAPPSAPVFGLATLPTGVSYAFRWDAARDLGPGTFEIAVRARACSARTSAFAHAAPFTVTLP